MAFNELAAALIRGVEPSVAFGEFSGAAVPAAFTEFALPDRAASPFEEFTGGAPGLLWHEQLWHPALWHPALWA